MSESRASVVLGWTLEHGRCQKVGASVLRGRTLKDGRCQKVGPPFASKVNTKAPFSKEMAPLLSDTWGCLRSVLYTIVHTGVRKVTPFIGLVTLVTLGPTLGDAYRSIPIRAATYDNWLVAAKRS